MRFWHCSDPTFGVWYARETNPETTPGENEATPAHQSGGTESPDVLRRDEWTAGIDRINERFDAIGQSIKEGFDGWTTRQANPVEGEAEPVSSSEQEEQEVEIQVQDRQLPPNRRPRTSLQPGTILRRLFLG